MYTLLGSTNNFASGNVKEIILPICTYNCQVWGKHFFHKKVLHLGVNPKASNWAVLVELNRSSLIPGIMTRMISFWKHSQDSPSPIMQETVKLSKALHEENNYSWFTGLSKIAEVLG